MEYLLMRNKGIITIAIKRVYILSSHLLSLLATNFYHNMLWTVEE
jgi:hypothetical protein